MLARRAPYPIRVRAAVFVVVVVMMLHGLWSDDAARVGVGCWCGARPTRFKCGLQFEQAPQGTLGGPWGVPGGTLGDAGGPWGTLGDRLLETENGAFPNMTILFWTHIPSAFAVLTLTLHKVRYGIPCNICLKDTHDEDYV